jgi:hypothetical protein
VGMGAGGGDVARTVVEEWGGGAAAIG